MERRVGCRTNRWMGAMAVALGMGVVTSACRDSGAGTHHSALDVGVDAGGDATDTADASHPPCEAGPWTVSSPNGRLKVELGIEDLGGTADFPDGPALYYRLTRDGEPVLRWSPLGMHTDQHHWLTDVCVVDQGSEDVSGSYEMKVGKRHHRQYEGVRRTLRLVDADGAALDIIFRADDDGVAYRYRVEGDGAYTVVGEDSGFAIPQDATGWMAPYDIFGGLLAGTYEGGYKKVSVGDPAPNSGWAYPALFELGQGGTWLMVTEADLDANYAGTRLHQKPVDGVYRVRLPSEEEGQGVGEVDPVGTLPLQTPWRVMIVGDLADVVESTLVDDLSRPSTIDDPSWAKPGRVAWSWFSQGTGDPALQRDYIQFAQSMGWEYDLIDAKWDKWSDPATQIPALVADADSRGVGLFLWYNSGGEHTSQPSQTPRDRMLDPQVRRAEMQKLEDWGVTGIKVDFFESDKQDRIQQYIGILKDAADHHLMVNFHGCTLPRGWQRTYPNLMTQEAVRGAEYYQGFNMPDASTDVIYAFTRNVVGSMDYTPVAFEAALDKAGITYAHSLAESVVFESGLQHFSDRADGSTEEGYGKVFADYPVIEQFMKQVPVTWDETRLVEGDPSSHVVLARRHGQTWYVGGLNGNDGAVTAQMPKGFLGDATLQGQCIVSGAAPDAVQTRQVTVGPDQGLEVDLAASDGFVCTLAP